MKCRVSAESSYSRYVNGVGERVDGACEPAASCILSVCVCSLCVRGTAPIPRACTSSERFHAHPVGILLLLV